MLDIFITGTDFKCGKTFITTGISATMQSLGYSTCVYKPVQTGGIKKNGFMQSPDLTFVKTIDPYIETKFSYLFKEKDIPLIASEKEGIKIDIQNIKRDYQFIQKEYDTVLLEGEGGVLTPLGEKLQNTNLIKILNIPVLFVATYPTSTLNSILAGINSLSDANLRGVILNKFQDKDLKSLPRLIEEYSDAKILGIMPEVKSIQDIISATLNGVDIESVFNVKIPKLELS